MFRIENIEYLFWLPGIPVLVVLFYGLMHWKKANLQKLGDEKLIRRLLPEYSKYMAWLKFAIYSVGLAFLIIALANPQFGGKKQKVKAKSSDVFLALDISQSMMAEDISPSRLERAKRFGSKLIRSLRGERIGLILFAGNAYLQMPLTKDYAASEIFVAAANPNQAGTQGTSFSNAIDLAIDAFEPDANTQKALIILSDGEDHEEEAIAAVGRAKAQNIVIYAIAAGTEKGAYIPVKNRGREEFKLDQNGQPVVSKVNLEIMADMAEESGGKFYSIDQENSVIKDIKSQIDRLQKKEVEQESFTDFTSYFQYFLAFGMLLMFIQFFIQEKKLSRKIWN